MGWSRPQPTPVYTALQRWGGPLPVSRSGSAHFLCHSFNITVILHSLTERRFLIHNYKLSKTNRRLLTSCLLPINCNIFPLHLPYPTYSVVNDGTGSESQRPMRGFAIKTPQISIGRKDVQIHKKMFSRAQCAQCASLYALWKARTLTTRALHRTQLAAAANFVQIHWSWHLYRGGHGQAKYLITGLKIFKFFLPVALMHSFACGAGGCWQG